MLVIRSGNPGDPPTVTDADVVEYRTVTEAATKAHAYAVSMGMTDEEKIYWVGLEAVDAWATLKGLKAPFR